MEYSFLFCYDMNGYVRRAALCYKKQYIMYHSAWETNQTDWQNIYYIDIIITTHFIT